MLIGIIHVVDERTDMFIAYFRIFQYSYFKVW